jgi:hypothetical protein
MRPKFWKGWIFALAAYALAYWAALNLALTFIYIIAAAMLAWTGFAAFRVCRLTTQKAYRATAPEWDREDFAFWLGATLSSIVLAALFLITPVRVG